MSSNIQILCRRSTSMISIGFLKFFTLVSIGSSSIINSTALQVLSHANLNNEVHEESIDENLNLIQDATGNIDLDEVPIIVIGTSDNVNGNCGSCHDIGQSEQTESAAFHPSSNINDVEPHSDLPSASTASPSCLSGLKSSAKKAVTSLCHRDTREALAKTVGSAVCTGGCIYLASTAVTTHASGPLCLTFFPKTCSSSCGPSTQCGPTATEISKIITDVIGGSIGGFMFKKYNKNIRRPMLDRYRKRLEVNGGKYGDAIWVCIWGGCGGEDNKDNSNTVVKIQVGPTPLTSSSSSSSTTLAVPQVPDANSNLQKKSPSSCQCLSSCFKSIALDLTSQDTRRQISKQLGKGCFSVTTVFASSHIPGMEEHCLQYIPKICQNFCGAGIGLFVWKKWHKNFSQPMTKRMREKYEEGVGENGGDWKKGVLVAVLDIPKATGMVCCGIKDNGSSESNDDSQSDSDQSNGNCITTAINSLSTKFNNLSLKGCKDGCLLNCKEFGESVCNPGSRNKFATTLCGNCFGGTLHDRICKNNSCINNLNSKFSKLSNCLSNNSQCICTQAGEQCGGRVQGWFREKVSIPKILPCWEGLWSGGDKSTGGKENENPLLLGSEETALQEGASSSSSSTANLNQNLQHNLNQNHQVDTARFLSNTYEKVD